MIDPVEITRALIRCPSTTPDDAGAQKMLRDILQDNGFLCTALSFGSVPNLFARLGTSAPFLCFAGHTDVVPPGDEKAWTYPPFEGAQSNGRLYGRGAVDMKGGIGCFVAALQAFLKKYGKPKGSIGLLITGDEEGPAVDGTVKVLEWMKDHGHSIDHCLVGEPSNPEKLGDEIKIGRRGSLTVRLSVKGKQGHVAYPHKADNPVPRLVRILDALLGAVLDRGSAHFQPSHIEITSIDVGNRVENMIPAQASAVFNVRFSDRWTGPALEAKLREIMDRASPDYTATFICGAESFVSPVGDFSRLVAQAVEDVTGRKPAASTKGGTSDARFIARYCPVVEFGLINATAHQVDECVEIDDLYVLTAVYGRILERYFTVRT